MRERLRHLEMPAALKPPRLIESLRNKLPELITTAGIGFGLRTTAQAGLVACGIGGLGMTVAAGALVGATISASKESIHQYRHEGGIHDKGRVLKKALTGAGIGAVGAFIGWELANLLLDPCVDTPDAGIPDPEPAETPLGGEPGGKPDFGQPTATSTPSIPEITEIPTIPSPFETQPPTLFNPITTPAPEIPCNPNLPDINLPKILPLPKGSTVWGESANYLQQKLCRIPTNQEILTLAKAVSRASNIQVSEWGINGSYLDTQLPVGYQLIFPN